MDRAVLRRDLRARRGVWNAVDDHPIVRREAGSDHAQAVAEIADPDRLGHDRAIRRDGHDDVLRLVGKDGGIGHQEARRRRADDQPDATELARRQKQVGVRHGGSGVDRPARSVERVVHEVERALPGEPCLVAERDLDLVGEASFASRAIAGKGQEIGLAHIEIQPDRIE